MDTAAADSTTDLDNVFTVESFARRYPDAAGSVASVRWAIHGAAHNGLAQSGAILRRGRRVLIHAPSWFRWLQAQAARS